MKLVETTRTVNTPQLRHLAETCYNHVMDLYPFTWEDSVRKIYKPQIQTMMLAKGMDEYEAASELYNHVKAPNPVIALTDKVFFMAALKIIIDEK